MLLIFRAMLREGISDFSQVEDRRMKTEPPLRNFSGKLSDVVKGGTAVDAAGRIFVSLENGQLMCFTGAAAR